jgi:eukaryotic-like serine/threonine-protein kinase
VTSSAEAARLYYEGIDCLRTRPSSAQTVLASCGPAFERALALDPGLALAHYQLAVMRMPLGGIIADGQADLEAAMRDVERLPAREAALVRALHAQVNGDPRAALDAYRTVLADDPDDLEALQGAAAGHLESGAWPDAVPYLEKLVALAPEQEDPAVQLVDALGRLGQRGALQARAAEWRAEGVTVARRKALVNALIWLGDTAGAREAASRLEPGELAPAPATLMTALAAAGAYEEVERIARAYAKVHPDDPWRAVLVARALAAQGRLREAVGMVEDATRGGPLRTSTWLGVDQWLAMLNMVRWDVESVREHAVRAAAMAPRDNADLALLLALLGDVEQADRIARALPAGSVAEAEFRALTSWRGGRASEAIAALMALENRDPLPISGLPPAYLVAELAASAGDPVQTLAAIARFRRLPPRGLVHCWAYPRSLLLSARAHLAVGDVSAARRDRDLLLSLQRRGDRDLPLSREARAIRLPE